MSDDWKTRFRDLYQAAQARYRVLHHFYAQLCPECAALNYEKRTQLAPLHGRVVLVTGARVKVGFQVAATLRPHPHPTKPEP